MHNFRGVPGWLVVGIAALVLGILGMHALGLHGPSAASTSTYAGAAPIHGGVHDSVDVASVHDADARQPSRGDSADPHGLHTMVGLCLAILAVGLVWLASTLGRRRGRFWAILPAPRFLPILRLSRLGVSGSGPPYALSYSVIRC